MIMYKELACTGLYFSVTNFILDLLLIYINLQLTILHKDTNQAYYIDLIHRLI